MPLEPPEDAAPLVPVPALNPPPPDLAQTLEPPASPPTDRDPPLMTAAQGDAILDRLEQIRRDGVERDKMLADAIVGLSTSLRDELNTKLDGQSLRFRENLDSAVELMQGAAEGVRLEVVEQGNRVMAEMDRRLGLENATLKGELHGLAKRVEDLKLVFDERWPVIEKLAIGAYNLSAAAADVADDHDAADRPTRAEAPRR